MVERHPGDGSTIGLGSIVRVVEAELVHRMRVALERDMRTNIPDDDPARVWKVVIGKYTGEVKGILLSVHADHPLGFGGKKHDQTAEGTPRTPMDRPWLFPPETLGGSKWRSFFGTVQVRSLLSKSPNNTVEILAMVKTRVAVCVNNSAELVGFKDDYGYRLIDVEMTDVYGYASGGGDTSVDRHWCDWIARVSYSRRRK